MFPPFGMGMMGMGMGMPMPMMPMMTPMMPTPGVMPGVPGQGWYNSLPGRFGRDMLGRGTLLDQAEWDPANHIAHLTLRHFRELIKRPGVSELTLDPCPSDYLSSPDRDKKDLTHTDECYRQPFQRAGWDGWGRPIVAAAAQPQPPAAAPAVTAGNPAAAAVAAGGAGTGAGLVPPAGIPATANTRDMPMSSGLYDPASTSTSSSSGRGRPDQPACFERPPAPSDSYYRYDDFEAFSLPSHALNHPWELHLPRELVSHDVNEEDWAKFIEDLARESITEATHDWAARNKGVLGRGPRPVLTDAVHSLLLSWAVAYFAPRGIRVYAAADGKRIIPPPLDPGSSRRGLSAANEWSDDDSDTLDGESTYEDERSARRNDMYLPRREREIRQDERARLRRRERRRRRELMEREGVNSRAGWSGVGGNLTKGEWEVHFVCAQPTIWTPGARPRTYGEPVVRHRR